MLPDFSRIMLVDRFGFPDPAGTRRQLIAAARQPGKFGVEAVVHLFRITPRLKLPDLLPELWRDPPANRVAWSVAFACGWRACSWRVAAAAGSRERVVRWAEAAAWDDFQLPYIRAVTGRRAELPARFPVWRGGIGSPAELGRGLCWTTDLRFAAHYARHRWQQMGCEGQPTIIRRRARREDPLWRWQADDVELLIARPARHTLVTDDVDQVAAWADQAAELHTAGAEALAVMSAEHAQSADGWGSWPG